MTDNTMHLQALVTADKAIGVMQSFESILNASPESAVGGVLAWIWTGDTIRIDLNHGTCDALVDETEIARRRGESTKPIPDSYTPWRSGTARSRASWARAGCWSSRSNTGAPPR